MSLHLIKEWEWWHPHPPRTDQLVTYRCPGRNETFGIYSLGFNSLEWISISHHPNGLAKTIRIMNSLYKSHHDGEVSYTRIKSREPGRVNVMKRTSPPPLDFRLDCCLATRRRLWSHPSFNIIWLVSSSAGLPQPRDCWLAGWLLPNRLNCRSKGAHSPNGRIDIIQRIN